MKYFFKYSLLFILITISSCKTTIDTYDISKTVIKYYFTNNSIYISDFDIKMQSTYRNIFNKYSNENNLIEYINGLILKSNDTSNIRQYFNSNNDIIKGFFPFYFNNNNRNLEKQHIISTYHTIEDFKNFPLKFLDIKYTNFKRFNKNGISIFVIFKNDLSSCYYFNLFYYYFEFTLINGNIYFKESNFVYIR